MTHVDVIKNEWLAGLQLVVARLWRDNSGLHVDASEPSWDAFVGSYRVDSNVDDARFLESLHETLRGDYVFATQPHDDNECPFQGHLVMPLQALDPQGERSIAGRGA